VSLNSPEISIRVPNPSNDVVIPILEPELESPHTSKFCWDDVVVIGEPASIVTKVVSANVVLSDEMPAAAWAF
jgi:hypothetical protein